MSSSLSEPKSFSEQLDEIFLNTIRVNELKGVPTDGSTNWVVVNGKVFEFSLSEAKASILALIEKEVS